MKKLISANIIAFLSVVIFFASCTAERDFVNASHIKKSNSEISFSQFKAETKLHDFKSTIQIKLGNTAVARTANGAYELSDFDVNTDIIKRLELDNKVTYTFRIFQKAIISTSSFYNLTMDYKDGHWIQNVIELKPTLENFDNLLGGLTNDINGKMSILFTSSTDGFTTTNNCYGVGIIGNNC